MDVNKRRLGALRTAALAQGVQGLIRTQAQDLCQYALWVGLQPPGDRQLHLYDKVLVDAPCSGLGVLAKRYAYAVSACKSALVRVHGRQPD